MDDRDLQQLYRDVKRDLEAFRETETGNVSVSVSVSASLPQHLQVRICMHVYVQMQNIMEQFFMQQCPHFL